MFVFKMGKIISKYLAKTTFLKIKNWKSRHVYFHKDSCETNHNITKFSQTFTINIIILDIPNNN
jgi:hypothetical protein